LCTPTLGKDISKIGLPPGTVIGQARRRRKCKRRGGASVQTPRVVKVQAPRGPKGRAKAQANTKSGEKRRKREAEQHKDETKKEKEHRDTS